MRLFHYDGANLLAGILFALFLLALSWCFATMAPAAVDTIVIDLGGTPVVLSVNATNKTMLTRRCATLAPGNTSLEDCIKILIVDMLRGYKVQSSGQDHVDACTTFKTLTGAQQTTIITQMGGTSPCP